MKIKGITIWEQYLEFFVLLIAAGVFVVFTAMQFIGNPNQVKGPSGDFSPSNVDQLLETAADAIAARLASGAPSPMVFPPYEPMLDTFSGGLEGSVSPESRLNQMWAHLPVDEVGGSAPPIGKPFINPTIAAPFDIVAKQSFDALLPETVSAHEELKARFPNEPYDLSWVTVAAKFNVKDVLTQFRQPGPDGEQSFVDRWYDNRVDMMDVKLEREEMVDGVWTGRTLLSPIPGQLTFRPQLQGVVRAQDRDRIRGDLANPLIQEAVIRPNFLATVGEWLPPVPGEIIDEGPKDELTQEQLEILRAQRNLRKLQATYESISKELEALGGELEEDDGRGQGGDRGGGGRSGGGGGGGGQPDGPSAGGGGRGLSSGGRDDAAKRAKQIQLTKAKRRLEARIKAAEERLASLGAVAAVAEPEAEESPDEVVIWAHDMTIVQGRKYRYRLSVDVYNPVFGRKLNLPQDQQARANQITIASASSEWVEMRAEEWLKVFVTQAVGSSDQGQQLGGLGLGTARVDVFRFQRGRWWKESFSVEPGDRIGAERQVRPGGRDGNPVPVDFSTNWYLLDVVEDIDADRALREKGFAADALLQGVIEADRVAMRDPAADYYDGLRQRLLEEVELAEIASQVEGTTSN